MSEFYARKHKDNLNRLIVTRDICQQKVVELEEEVRMLTYADVCGRMLTSSTALSSRATYASGRWRS